MTVSSASSAYKVTLTMRASGVVAASTVIRVGPWRSVTEAGSTNRTVTGPGADAGGSSADAAVATVTEAIVAATAMAAASAAVNAKAYVAFSRRGRNRPTGARPRCSAGTGPL